MDMRVGDSEKKRKLGTTTQGASLVPPATVAFATIYPVQATRNLFLVALVITSDDITSTLSCYSLHPNAFYILSNEFPYIYICGE